MKNRFNVNEEEKNRIRLLHGMKVITEQPEEDEPIMPDEEVIDVEDSIVLPEVTLTPEQEEQEEQDVADEELTADEVEAVVNPEKEDTWLAEKWEDLTDEVRNIFSRLKIFRMCRGKNACYAFNKKSKRRKRRMLSRISINWPKIRFRLPWEVKKVLSDFKRKRRHEKSKRRWKRQHKLG